MPIHHWQYNCKAYQTALAFHHHFLSGSCGNCSFLKTLLRVTGKQQASLQSPLAIYGKAKFFCEERAHSFAPFAHTTFCWPWNYATWCCVIRQVPMLCGLLSHMQPALKFPAHKLRNFLFWFWPHPCLEPVKEI
jgi:hypothetical protein